MRSNRLNLQYDPLDLLTGAVGRSPNGPSLLAAQKAAAMAGRPLTIEALLDLHAGSQAYFGTVLDLIRAEINFRRSRGEGVHADDYSRFPELTDAVRLLLSPEFDQLGASRIGRLVKALDDAAIPPAVLSTVESLKTPDERMRFPEIAGYAILGVLGRGGMGVVYKALHLRLDRIVALKMMHDRNANPTRRMRFLAEADAVAKLQHPNIVQLYGIGEEGGDSFFTMEYCDGGSLAALTDIAPRDAAGIVADIAEAVAYAHSRGILHRDLKPENVLLTGGESRIPKISDFGLARRLDEAEGLTATGDVIGTPAYIAPEQAEGGRANGPSVDVYGLGAVLYRLLTGQPPFQAETPVATLREVVKREPAAPRNIRRDVPSDLESICLLALAKEPAHRYSSAMDLAKDLRRFLDGATVLARPVPGTIKAWRWVRRNPGIAAAVAGISLSLLAASVLSILFAISTRRNARAEMMAAEERLKREHIEAGTDEACRNAIETCYALISQGRIEDAADQMKTLDKWDVSGSMAGKRDECRRDVEFCVGADGILLKNADLEYDMDRTGTGPNAKIAAAYVEIFAKAELPALRLPLSEAAEMVRNRRIAPQILGAIIDWADNARPEQIMPLMKVAAGAATDPFQKELLGHVVANRVRPAAGMVPTGNQPSMIVALCVKLQELMGRKEQALATLRSVRRGRPDDYWHNFELGKGLYREGRSTEELAEAEGAFRAALAIRPRSAGTRVFLVEILIKRKKYEEGLREISEWGTLLGDSAASQFCKARIFEESGEVQDALAAYREALRINPEVVKAKYGLARLLESTDDTKAAKRLYEECVDQAPEYAEARVNLAAILIREGRLDDAEKHLREAIRLQPALAMAWNNLAFNFLRKGQIKDATEAQRKAVELEPLNEKFKRNLRQLEKGP